MSETTVVQDLRAYLATAPTVAEDSALGLKLLHAAYNELTNPTAQAGGAYDDSHERDEEITRLWALLAYDPDDGKSFVEHVEETIERMTNIDNFAASVMELVQAPSFADCLNAIRYSGKRIADLELALAERDRVIEQMDPRTAAEAPAPTTASGGVPTTEHWVSDAVDLAHAVAADLSPENRVMAKAARSLILTAPKGDA